MTPKKTIWIINQYAVTPETGQGARHYHLAKNLANLGYDVYLITASFTHYLKEPIQVEKTFKIKKESENLSFVWVKVPDYADAHNKQRILNWFLFAWKIAKLKGRLPKPDVILYSSPSLVGYLGAEKLAKTFKIPLAFEVRDIWPLTLYEIGGYSLNHPFIKFLQAIEKRAYSKSNIVISNLKNSYQHMQSLGMDDDKFTWIPNGVSISALKNIEKVSNSVLDKIPLNKFIVGYTGTLGEANAMDYLIEAADILRDEKDIHFVIVGTGKHKGKLIEKVRLLDINNVTFIDPVKKLQVQSVIELFDVCYIGWHKKSLYRYGIAANKIPEYMYSATPVIHSFSGQGDFIQQAQSGITVEAENPQAIADAILQLYSLSESERENMGIRGKEFVLENLTYEKLTLKLEEALFKGK
ncbi:glycosyltransferase family 4 protein [Psychrobacter celer]|uniref:glycosyltransferase family 4 protein n=1 Tax=Psychrobacter celer TaxID=306572 RepID=UPI003FD2EA42